MNEPGSSREATPEPLPIALLRRLWHPRLEDLPRWKEAILRAARIAFAVGRDLWHGDLNLHAMSLVYTTLLSLVPLLAVSFSVLKAFGVHNQAQPVLLNFLRPLGPRGAELTNQIIQAVENMNVGVLSSLGVAMLLYTVLSLIQKIERAFNFTWRISRSRKLSQRFSDYLSVVLVGPVLIFSALGMIASLMGTRVVTRMLAIEPVSMAVKLSGQILPYLLVIAAFTFFYVFVPNTRVRFPPALIGALVAGILWESLGRGFASFVVTSARYAGLYSGFVILLIFMIWLYLSWLTLLVGASIAFYCQHPEYLTAAPRELSLSARLREKAALLVIYLIGRSHYGQQRPLGARDLAQRLGAPMDAVAGVLDALEERGLLAQSGDRETVYLPARPLETVRLSEVLEAVRASGESPFLNPERLTAEPAVEAVERRIDRALQRTLGGTTVKDLVTGEEAP